MNPKQYSRLNPAEEAPENDMETGDESETEKGSLITLDEDELPESKDWKDGETYNLSLTVKQVSKGEFEVLEAEEESPEEEKAEGGAEEPMGAEGKNE